MSQPLIGLTMGDPAGIGPEIGLRALADPAVLDSCRPVLFGEAALLERVAVASGAPRPPRVLSLAEWRRAPGAAPAVVDLATLGDSGAVRAGEVQAEAGRAAAASVRAVAGEALAGRLAAMVTAPLHKEALRLAGEPYPGHTEMLASLTGARRHAMMLASDRLTVSLATIHVPLSEVPGRLTMRGILDVIELTAEAMGRLRGRPPRLAVCALNPHAGEHGLFGAEEREIILPAVEAARAQGIDIDGPLPPDTAFLPARLRGTDAYVAMYHDQGLIPFKMLAFETGVNVTLGLPIVRTSVDHGTAFDIAWQGVASPRSLVEAVRLAVALARTAGSAAGQRQDGRD